MATLLLLQFELLSQRLYALHELTQIISRCLLTSSRTTYKFGRDCHQTKSYHQHDETGPWIHLRFPRFHIFHHLLEPLRRVFVVMQAVHLARRAINEESRGKVSSLLGKLI